jgi:hypothetical protein
MRASLSLPLHTRTQKPHSLYTRWQLARRYLPVDANLSGQPPRPSLPLTRTLTLSPLPHPLRQRKSALTVRRPASHPVISLHSHEKKMWQGGSAPEHQLHFCIAAAVKQL